MEHDLHGLTLEEAKEEILEALRKCENKGITVITSTS